MLQEEFCLRSTTMVSGIPSRIAHSQMSKEEHNYEIYDREMLGLIHALEDWSHFLEGITFKVIIDHKNIEWWTTMRDLNRQRARWSLYLSQFTFKVTYRKGESMQAQVDLPQTTYQTEKITDRSQLSFLSISGQWQQHTINLLVTPLESASVRLVLEKPKS